MSKEIFDYDYPIYCYQNDYFHKRKSNPIFTSDFDKF